MDIVNMDIDNIIDRVRCAIILIKCESRCVDSQDCLFYILLLM